MAHQINRHKLTGKDAFFSVKEKAWHGLGQIVEDYPTAAEAIEYAGLNFEVVKEKLFINNPDLQEVADFYATTRTDTNEILGVVGSKYEVVQNKTVFTFFDEIVQGGRVLYETAGALGKGERIFLTAKMPDNLRISKDDVIEKYIFLTSSHDGRASITAAFTPVRIVCNNTLQMALRNNTNAVTIRHTANAEEALREAARIMRIQETNGELLEGMLRRWAKIEVTDNEVKKLIALAMAPNKEVFKALTTNDRNFKPSKQFADVCEDVFSYYAGHETQQLDTCKGTLYGAYNSISGYYQNVAPFKDESAKLSSILGGTVADRTKAAFELCSKAQEFLS